MLIPNSLNDWFICRSKIVLVTSYRIALVGFLFRFKDELLVNWVNRSISFVS